jgi:hypothetical protein
MSVRKAQVVVVVVVRGGQSLQPVFRLLPAGREKTLQSLRVHMAVLGSRSVAGSGVLLLLPCMLAAISPTLH